MKVVRLKAPASVASLRVLEDDPPVPKAGEVLVRLRASSLNPHDDFVVRGLIPVADGRIPLTDGAGEVLACGEGVTELSVGDAVVSTFWPYWLSGDMTAATRRDIATLSWGEKAKVFTDGRGVDQVIEVGGPATFAQSMAACRLGGHIAVIGLLSGVAAEVNIPALFSAQLRVSGISIGSRADQEDMIRAIQVNGIEPVMDRNFGLEEIAAAFQYYQTQSRFGKIGIDI